MSAQIIPFPLQRARQQRKSPRMSDADKALLLWGLATLGREHPAWHDEVEVWLEPRQGPERAV